MTTRFEVHGSFALEARALFVLSGVITEGMVQTGMRATLEGDEDAFTAKVHGVEFLDVAEGAGGTGEPSITFSYSDSEKLARWQAIDWASRTLKLEW